MEGVRGRYREAVEVELRQEDVQDCAVWRNGILGNFGGMAFWGTSNPCKRRNTDVKPMMKIMKCFTAVGFTCGM
jgi:hypothetical protein